MYNELEYWNLCIQTTIVMKDSKVSMSKLLCIIVRAMHEFTVYHVQCIGS